MPQTVLLELELPTDMRKFEFPRALDRRLQDLLDRQSDKGRLTKAEREEAKGLVKMAEMLTLLRLRAERGRRKR